jgi:hypothetical protein
MKNTTHKKMGKLKLIRKSYNNPTTYRIIRDCPKDVTVTIDGGFVVEVDINGKLISIRDSELKEWVKSPDNHNITPRLCGVFYDMFGFIPFQGNRSGDYIVCYNRLADPTASSTYVKSIKDTIMVEFMGIQLPKAVVKQMRFIRETQEESGTVFSNLKDFEPKIEEFPLEIMNSVLLALRELLIEYRWNYKYPVKYFYIYEMLGIPFSTQKYFINGEDLVELNDNNLMKYCKFYRYEVFSMPPFPQVTTLTTEDVSYITDTMIESFHLWRGFMLTTPSTPFQKRICTYFASH